MTLELTDEQWKEMQVLLEDYRTYGSDDSYALHLAYFVNQSLTTLKG